MENDAAGQAVQDILDNCRLSLGPNLEGAYLFGSLVTGGFEPNESDINLLLILADQADMHALRRTYRPVWLRHQDILGQSPVVVRRSALTRYLHLFPLLADHLVKHGRLLAGNDCLEQLPPAPAALEPLARLAGEVMAASAALAPQILQPDRGQNLLRRLRRLFRQTMGQPAPAGTPAAELVGHLTQYWIQQFNGLQGLQPAKPFDWPLVAPPVGAPALLPHLQAIYEIEDRLILVLPDIPAADAAALIAGIDWPAVADSVGQHYYSLHITTPDQLRLCLYYEEPAAYYFGRYTHAWGTDLFTGFCTPIQLVVRDLARRPAEIGAVALPHAYLTAGDDDLPQVIHDFQNKLLNIQLQQELFARIEGRPRAIPPEPLPTRDAAPAERIDAIFSQLDWWADYYSAAQQSATPQPAG